MLIRQINPFISWWLTPKLPKEHIFVYWNENKLPVQKRIQVYFKHYLVHPVKRRIARYYLIFLRNVFGLKVIAITGSAGKTTTKDMLYSILKLFSPTIASYKNIDPIYNIPATILRCRPNTKFLILEMGVEYKGEMDFYLWLAKPDIGIITNISATHTKYFGSIDGVFQEKSKLVKTLTSKDIAVLNYEDTRLVDLANNISAKVVWYGKGTGTSALRLIIKNSISTFKLLFDKRNNAQTLIKLSVIGSQFVNNALAAAVTANELGMSTMKIKKGLENFTSPEHRMKIIKVKNGATILDDSYNNNPTAAQLAIQTLFELAGKNKKVVVFGDMLELGKLEKKYHLDIAKLIMNRYMQLHKIICIGNTSKIIYDYLNHGKANIASYYKTWRNALPEVKTLSENRHTIILVKGSRSIHLDELVDAL
jgi:UDP-N-acetylmuramoyl-tripeptide--D-alanyl-D-alanine ligase